MDHLHFASHVTTTTIQTLFAFTDSIMGQCIYYVHSICCCQVKGQYYTFPLCHVLRIVIKGMYGFDIMYYVDSVNKGMLILSALLSMHVCMCMYGLFVLVYVFASGFKLRYFASYTLMSTSAVISQIARTLRKYWVDSILWNYGHVSLAKLCVCHCSNDVSHGQSGLICLSLMPTVVGPCSGLIVHYIEIYYEL